MNNNQAINEIVETTIDLYRDNEAQDVTYSRIEEQLGKKEGYVFLYFDHKADLVSTCVETLADRLVENMVQILRESGSVVGRFLKMDKALKDTIALMGCLTDGQDRNLEDASIVTQARTKRYQDLAAAFEVFIEDGNAQGVFHADRPEEKAVFIAFGLQGLRCCCGNELRKQAAFYQCMESILGTDLKNYLKIAA